MIATQWSCCTFRLYALGVFVIQLNIIQWSCFTFRLYALGDCVILMIVTQWSCCTFRLYALGDFVIQVIIIHWSCTFDWKLTNLCRPATQQLTGETPSLLLHVHRDRNRLVRGGSSGRPRRFLRSSSWVLVLLLQCCFTSTETVRTIRDFSPGHPPRLSHSSYGVWFLVFTQSCGASCPH